MPTKRFYVDLDLNGAGIHSVADAVLPGDVPNYAQLQALTLGLAWKQAVRAASTANVSLTSPGASIDGVTLANGDRVLLKNQASPAENGIYLWTGATSALTRAGDANTGAKLQSATVSIAAGTTNADRAYTQTADGVTVGTTALAWAQVSGQGLYTAGNGIDVTNSVITALAGAGIRVTASGIEIDSSLVARKFSQTYPGAASVTVTHGLASTDPIVQLRDAATNAVIEADVVVTSSSAVTLGFTSFPASVRVTVVA